MPESNLTTTVRRVTHVLPDFPKPLWDVRHGEHVIAGAIATIDDRVEVQILLNGTPLYRSRHTTRESAEGEMALLQAHFYRDDDHHSHES